MAQREAQGVNWTTDLKRPIEIVSTVRCVSLGIMLLSCRASLPGPQSPLCFSQAKQSPSSDRTGRVSHTETAHVVRMATSSPRQVSGSSKT